MLRCVQVAGSSQFGSDCTKAPLAPLASLYDVAMAGKETQLEAYILQSVLTDELGATDHLMTVAWRHGLDEQVEPTSAQIAVPTSNILSLVPINSTSSATERTHLSAA